MSQPSKGIHAMLRSEAFRSYAFIVIGCVLGGIAYPLFMTPNNIAPGGLTGVATIINYLSGAPVGVTSLLLNVPLFLIGYRSMGRTFAFRSLVATVLFSLCIDLFPLAPVTDDMLLGSVFGGVLLGLGLGLILRGGATTGGSDMIARMVHKRLPFITVGAFLFFVDCLVILCAAFTVSARAALYALINIFISAKMVDLVMAGFGTSKACFIITNHAEEITRRVLEEMDRGATLLNGTGAYSGQNRQVVISVVANRETVKLKRIVKSVDPVAFMFVTDTHETLGEGFAAWAE